MKTLLLLSLALVTACASVQHDPEYDGSTLRDAALCLKLGPCTVVQVESRNFYDAELTVNGQRLGYAVGNSHTTLFVPNVRLDPSGCGVIRAVFRMTSVAVSSSKECVRPGDHFNLDIDPSSPLQPFPKIWLNPRR